MYFFEIFRYMYVCYVVAIWQAVFSKYKNKDTVSSRLQKSLVVYPGKEQALEQFWELTWRPTEEKGNWEASGRGGTTL